MFGKWRNLPCTSASHRISWEPKRSAYLLSLVRRDASCNQFNVSRCALRFFFQVTLKREFPDIVCAKKPKKLPVVLSQSEVANCWRPRGS